MYAIINTRTGKFVYGTDYRYCPPKQRTSENQMRTYTDLYSAKADFLHRQCGKDYKIARLKPVEVEQIIQPPSNYSDINSDDIFKK